MAEKYLRKGAKVYVEGSLQTRKWTDQNGADRYSTEVVIGRFKGELTMLDSRGFEGGDRPAREPAPRQERMAMPERREPMPDLSDDVPF